MYPSETVCPSTKVAVMYMRSYFTQSILPSPVLYALSQAESAVEDPSSAGGAAASAAALSWTTAATTVSPDSAGSTPLNPVSFSTQ